MNKLIYISQFWFFSSELWVYNSQLPIDSHYVWVSHWILLLICSIQTIHSKHWIIAGAQSGNTLQQGHIS